MSASSLSIWSADVVRRCPAGTSSNASPASGQGRAGSSSGVSPAGTDPSGVFVDRRLVQRERAALGDAQRLVQQLRGVDPFEREPVAKMALRVGVERESGCGNRGPEPDRGQSVLEPLARSDVHVDVTGCNQRQARHASKMLQHLKPRVIARPPEQLDRDPGAKGNARAMRCASAICGS